MKYLVKFNENMALAKSIISKKMEAFDKLKSLLKSNLGYIGKFTEYLMNENIPYVELENIYKDLVELKNKQKPIDISNLNYEGVVDKIQVYKNDLSINSIITQFPSEQKAFARELIKTTNGYNLLLKASKSDKLEILISKIRRYHSKSELSSALTLFSKEAMNDREAIKEYLKDSKSSIVFETDDIMIVKVASITDIQKLGSDTSWCILGQSMWNSYTSNRYQYILYDFTKDDWDPKFKIGFTLNKDFTIHAAHDILDSGSSPYLQNFMTTNGIKYSELVPKSEVVTVTNQMIEDIKKSTKVSTLTQYSDNISLEQIPLFLKKLFNVSVDARSRTTFSGGIVLGSTKIEMIKSCLNRYFSDKEFVTSDDLGKIDSRLPSMIQSLCSKDSGILKQKFAPSKPTFSERYLKPSIIVKMLDTWKTEDLIHSFSSSLDDVLKVPGSSYLYSFNELRWGTGWDKEMVTVLSDKLNQIYDKFDWKNVAIITNNAHLGKSFIKNYIILNYALDRKNIVKKEALSQLREDDKLEYAYLLKMPVDLSKCQYIRRITSWIVPYIIKKDYDDKAIRFENFNDTVKLVDHLLGYKLKFKIPKTNFDGISRIRGNAPNSKGKEIINDLLSKFKVRRRVGDIVETDDKKVSIELV
jgi:hypothetical protein